MNLRGRFIVFDGPDGSGKGTQLARVEAAVASAGGTVVRAKDPGGTAIGDRIRHVLLHENVLKDMAPRCEALLFMASRAQLVHQIVRPAIAAGSAVLCDRFISATCAYQVAAGFPREEVIQLGRNAIGDCWPDLTIVLDVPSDVGFARTGRTPQNAAAFEKRKNKSVDQLKLIDGDEPDAIERRSLDYHRRVRELFLELPAHYPAPVTIIDASRDADAVFTDVREALRRAFG